MCIRDRPRTGISSGTLRSVIEYGGYLYLFSNDIAKCNVHLKCNNMNYWRIVPEGCTLILEVGIPEFPHFIAQFRTGQRKLNAKKLALSV